MTLTKFPLVLAAASLTFVAACDPATSPNQAQNAQQGAVIGAVGGAVTGLLLNRDDDRRGRNQAAIAGAIIGAAGGAAIGSNLDRQAEELRRQLRNDVGVSNNGEKAKRPNIILYFEHTLTGSNCTRVFTTSTGVRAP